MNIHCQFHGDWSSHWWDIAVTRSVERTRRMNSLKTKCLRWQCHNRRKKLVKTVRTSLISPSVKPAGFWTTTCVTTLWNKSPRNQLIFKMHSYDNDAKLSITVQNNGFHRIPSIIHTSECKIILKSTQVTWFYLQTCLTAHKCVICAAFMQRVLSHVTAWRKYLSRTRQFLQFTSVNIYVGGNKYTFKCRFTT